MPKNSQSIEESRQNGVFLQALVVDNPIINIGENKTDTIKQIWVEDAWTYEKENGTTVIKKDSFQQVLILLGSLSDSSSDHIFLKDRNGYFGWDRVLFNSYVSDKDTIFVINKLLNLVINIDMIHIMIIITT